MIRNDVCRGFSLIELMIVVAIISILAAIAIPSYQNYTRKAKFTEIVQAVAPFKLAVEACAHERDSLAECVNSADGAGQNGIPAAIGNSADVKSYVKSITVSVAGKDSIKITGLSQHIGDYSYILGAVWQKDALVWSRDPASTCIAVGLC